jgi:MFS family permease
VSAKFGERDLSYGWVMVAVAFTLSALSFGALGAISVFLKPLSMEFGWSRGDTSLGYTAIAFSSALFGLLWGVVADRFGTRWFGVVAALIMALSLYMLSEQRSITDFYLYYFLFGAFGNAMVSTPLFPMSVFGFAPGPVWPSALPPLVAPLGRGLFPISPGCRLPSTAGAIPI